MQGFYAKKALERFELYDINLKNLAPGVHAFSYLLENKFFMDIGGDLVQKGEINASLQVKRFSMMSEMDFQIKGVVHIPCDRCLDEMEQPIESTNRLVVKFGKEPAEESDDVVIITEEEGKINLAWYIYECIVLAIPLKHVHAPGQCNKKMELKLKKHTAGNSEEEETDMLEEDVETPGRTDPRWDVLKQLLKNDNN